MRLLTALFLGFSAMLALPADAAQNVVKLSNSGICHDSSSAWYSRTKNFTPFETMAACLEVGRAPKSYSGPTTTSAQGGQYDRDLFGGWADEDGDCMNTRHELLAELSTSRVTYSRDSCYVVRGRWNDPYTGQVFLNARNMDVDHLVPLYWAWQHGADRWPEAKRERFANDPVNLFAVDAGTNRSKSADGPLDWMPPNRGFHCQYVLRFTRVVKTYGLTLSSREARGFTQLQSRVCG
jgi:hypothetical protein